MSLSITNVVDVSILLAPKPKALQSFGKLCFVTDEVPTLAGIQSQRLYAYKDLESVAAEWGMTAEVYKAATAFYGTGAKDFYVARASAEATAATLIGGLHASLSELQKVTAGSMTISVDGMQYSVTNLDLSGAVNEDAVAKKLGEQISGATVTFSDGHYVVKSKRTGIGSSITVATDGDQKPASKLGLSDLALNTEARGIVVDAKIPETPTEALSDAADIDPSYYGIDIHKKWRDSSAAEDVAAYAQGSRRVFFCTTNDASVLDPTSDKDFATKIKDKSMGRTLMHYSSHPSEYPSSAVAGRAFLVNFEGTNTTITLNLKVLAGITVEKLRQSEYNAMLDKNCNAVVDIAGMYVYSDSRMGDGMWFDAVHGVDWLQNRVETGLFNRLYSTTTKVPYTDAGVAILIAEIEGACRQAVTNGLVAPGRDSEGNYLPLGYEINYIPTSEVSAADKGNRIYRGLTFKVVGAGAMHSVVVSGAYNE